MSGLLQLPMTFGVLLYQSIVLALSQIWANKLRSILTAIGIVIGVASVTAVIAGLTGMRTQVLSEFESFGTNKVFILSEFPESGPKRNGPWPIIVFQPDIFEGLLENCPSLKAYSRVTTRGVKVIAGTQIENNVEMLGIDAGWHEVENRYVTMGRPFSLIDMSQSRPVCLVSPKVVEKLRLPRDPVGSYLVADERRLQIIGVVEPRIESAMFGGGGEGLEILVPFKLVHRQYAFILGIAAAKTPEVSEEAEAEITFFLRQKRRLDLGEPNTFRIEFIDQFVQQFKSISAGITAVAAGVVGISLLVGGVGIMNIMLVSVSERTREIGLRKAVGARPMAILLQFLVEAITLCCVGGAIGLAMGQGMTMMIKAIPGATMLSKATIPAWAVALSFGFSVAVGVIFGMFPAIKAARLDPIVALRHE